MKKKLIALVVAASAAVSGSAMAAGWEQNGTGGSVDMGGTLTPVEKVTPWEVKVGDAVTGLDAQVQKGQKVVDVAVEKAIPVLGIRTVVGSTETFNGRPGIAPAIDFHGKIDLDGFSDSITTLTLDVNNANGEKIGSMTAPLLSGAEGSYKNSNNTDSGKKYLFASQAGKAFFGTVPKVADQVGAVYHKLTGISPDYTAHYNDQGTTAKSAGEESFIYEGYTYSAYYGAAIQSGKVIKIALDQPVAGDDPIQWKASLPVTVSYQ